MGSVLPEKVGELGNGGYGGGRRWGRTGPQARFRSALVDSFDVRTPGVTAVLRGTSASLGEASIDGNRRSLGRLGFATVGTGKVRARARGGGRSWGRGRHLGILIPSPELGGRRGCAARIDGRRVDSEQLPAGDDDTFAKKTLGFAGIRPQSLPAEMLLKLLLQAPWTF